MGTGGADKDDGLARLQRANPMQDFHAQQRPTLTGFGFDLGQGLFGHAGIMLQQHAGDCFAVIKVAHVTDKADHRADAQIGVMQGTQLSPRIEGRSLHTNSHNGVPFG